MAKVKASGKTVAGEIGRFLEGASKGYLAQKTLQGKKASSAKEQMQLALMAKLMTPTQKVNGVGNSIGSIVQDESVQGISLPLSQILAVYLVVVLANHL